MTKAERSARAQAIVADPTLPDDELAVIAKVRGSTLHKPLSTVFTLFRNQDREILGNPATDFPTTQFTRGRLSMLSDLVLLLEDEAPKAYDNRRQAAERKSSEPKS